MLQMHKRGWPNQPKFWHGPGRKPAKGLCGNERGTGRSILAVRYYDWIAHFSRRTPDKTAVVDLASERRFSYAQFDARIARLATHLTERLGVNRGDRVAVLALNTTDTLEVQFACGRLGAIFVPLNIRLNVPELEFIVGDAAPKVMVHDTDLADTALAVARACDVPSGLLLGPGGTYEAAIAAATRLKRSEDVTLDDVSTIMYTSGATGRPKGAMITHGMTFWNCVNLGGPAYITPSSVLLTVLPLFHTGGLNCYTKQQGYGMTETSSAVLALDREDAARKAGSAGKPVLHTEVRVVRPDGTDVAPGELGELWVRGPNVTPGYWNRPDANKSSFTDGWLHTGDATRVDDEGFYYIVDRWKDMYISGGENVYPAEVENVLHQLSAISEAAVIGIPDPQWGETGMAIVAVKQGQAITEAEIFAHCSKNLARFKCPRQIRFVEALPRNATGKIHKPTLRQNFSVASATDIARAKAS
jgi:acyl-CoA synthetase (AMP-forming)/AMP-acid ligase II